MATACKQEGMADCCGVCCVSHVRMQAGKGSKARTVFSHELHLFDPVKYQWSEVRTAPPHDREPMRATQVSPIDPNPMDDLGLVGGP